MINDLGVAMPSEGISYKLIIVIVYVLNINISYATPIEYAIRNKFIPSVNSGYLCSDVERQLTLADWGSRSRMTFLKRNKQRKLDKTV